MVKHYTRVKRFEIDDVRDLREQNPPIVNTAKEVRFLSKFKPIYVPTIVEGHKVNLHTFRMNALFANKPWCLACSINATHFWLEYDSGTNLRPLNKKVPSAHFNLYGINPYGHEVMFTVDHILPKAHGGKDDLSNSTILCAKCNRLKGSDQDWLTDLPRDKRGNLIHRTDRQIVGNKKESVL